MARGWLLVAIVAGCGGGSGCGSPGSAPDAGAPNPGPTCSPEAATPVSAQSRARLGAYFFDGWTGPLTNFHFNGLVNGPYSGRQPLTGWLDSQSCIIEEELATARAFGVDFFVFDWYFGAPGSANGEDLNSALKIARSLPDRHGMQYAILYVNAPPFIIAPADWPTAVAEWVNYFQDPAYLRVAGKPMLMVIDSQTMRSTFGSSAAVQAALETLRTSARDARLPGAYVVAGFGAPYLNDSPNFERRVIDAFVADGYDAISTYNYPGTPNPGGATMLPWSALAGGAHWIWQEAAAYSPLPFIPVAMAGWDSRPWNGPTTVWYPRTPADFAALVADALDWAEATPALRAETPPTPPLVLIEAWNELGEGSYFIPTVGEGRSYGDALAGVLGAAAPRARTVLTVADSGAASADRTASGTLADAAAAPIAGATVAVTATARDGAGLYAAATLADRVPADAAQAVVGFRVNSEFEPPALTPSASSFALYQASYKEADGPEHVANSDFSGGTTSWSVGGVAQLVASDRGAGNMLSVQATPAQTAALTSAPFGVTPGNAFALTMSARVAPSTPGSGYFTIIFLDGTGVETSRLWIPLAPGKAAVGSATTNASGAYQVSLSSLGAANVTVEASYAGDATRYPARTVAP